MNTIINGKSINIIDKNEIGMKFTELVNSYINKGLTFDMNHNHGTQGELASVVLTDGIYCWKIYIISESKFLNDFWSRYSTFEIKVKKYEKSERTLWLSEGEEIYTKIYYQLLNSENKFIADLDEFNAYVKMHDDRRDMHRKVSCLRQDAMRIMPTTTHKIAVKMLKKVRGYKSVSVNEIKSVQKDVVSNSVMYTVYFNENSKKSSYVIYEHRF